MTKLWLTYAWKDNQDQDVDHVVQELRRAGLEVEFDRARLIPGQRLWPQIDNAISDPATDAWAILATENSLNSEPCLEELAYALDRALRARGTDFPLIGIFPEPIDGALIPSAIATRLYVTLQQPNWAELVVAGARKQKPSAPTDTVAPFVAKFHNDRSALEIRPRSGRWYPCIIGVPKNGPLKIRIVLPGPSGFPPSAGMVNRGEYPIESSDGGWSFEIVNHAIDALNSLYVWFEGPLRGEIAFGPGGQGSNYYIVKFEQIPGVIAPS